MEKNQQVLTWAQKSSVHRKKKWLCSLDGFSTSVPHKTFLREIYISSKIFLQIEQIECSLRFLHKHLFMGLNLNPQEQGHFKPGL